MVTFNLKFEIKIEFKSELEFRWLNIPKYSNCTWISADERVQFISDIWVRRQINLKRRKFNLRPRLWKKSIKFFGIQKINIGLSILGKRNIVTSKYLLFGGNLGNLIYDFVQREKCIFSSRTRRRLIFSKFSSSSVKFCKRSWTLCCH